LKDKWTQSYRGTRVGLGVNDFHSKCENTFTKLKAHRTSYIFDGFISITWNLSAQPKSGLGMALYYYFEIKNKVPLYYLYFHKNDFFNSKVVKTLKKSILRKILKNNKINM
jgi:hypothetical protein